MNFREIEKEFIKIKAEKGDFFKSKVTNKIYYIVKNGIDENFAVIDLKNNEILGFFESIEEGLRNTTGEYNYKIIKAEDVELIIKK